MRAAASNRMKSLWADKSVRETRSLAAKRQASCPDCGETNVDKFYQDKLGRRTNARCMECHKIKCKVRWHSMSQIEKQATRVNATYGLTPEQFYEMHKKQNGKCAICNQEPKTKRGLHVDHCHTSNRVRGLLCHGCNTGIGAMKENVSIMRNAISYLGG